MSNLKTAVCAIGRMENAYAKEFVDYYLNLGFTNIIIADNNHDGEEHFEDVLEDYVNQGSVIILDYRNKVGYQMAAYSEMYEKFKNDYDWIAFFDFDEYLTIKTNIQDFLSDKNDYDAVLINWMCFGDNDNIHYEDKPLQERFTKPLPFDKCVQYMFPENAHIKSIIKGGLYVYFRSNPHIPNTPLKCCNASGTRVANSPWQNIDYSNGYIRHYVTKSLEEWVNNKMKRGTADRNYETFIRFYKDRYFLYNQMTEEKQNYLKSIEAISEPTKPLS